MKNGGWVFLSHSHKDIDLVRNIRNYFERLGFEPLMFYLKCLSDEDEIENLIKREINERDWFVYVDSPNARKSKWVQTERDYIEQLDGKNIFTIDLDSDIDSQLRAIDHISRQMKVFISYSHKDKELKDKIEQKLISKDMLVLSDECLRVGDDWFDSISNMIYESIRNGFVIVLITKNSNSVMIDEVELSIASKGKIIPVFVDGATLTPQLFELLKGNIKGVNINSNPTDEELNKIVDSIFHNVEFYDSDFTNSYGYRSAEIIELPSISQMDDLTFGDCPNLKCVYIPNSVIYIAPNTFDKHPNILVKCYSGSYAESFCKKHGLSFEIIQE